MRTSVKLSTPCFVRTTDIEERTKLVSWLESIGYTYCVGCFNARSAISSPLIPYIYAAYKVMEEELTPAFTVEDLLCVLPKILYDNHGHGLPINMTTSTGSNWCLYWGNPHTGIGCRDSNSLVDLLTEAIEWVITKGYKLNV